MPRKKEKIEEQKQEKITEIETIVVDGVEKKLLKREHLLEAESFCFEIASYVEAIRARNIEAAKLEQDLLIKISHLRQEAKFYEEKRFLTIDKRKRFFGKLNEIYDVNFEKATYDSETGVITVIEEKNDAAMKQRLRKERE